MLLDRAPQPDTEFEDLYRSDVESVTRLAYLLVRSRAIAEELTQEAFLRLYERFDTVETPAGWLRTAVVRLAISWQRRQELERRRATEATDSDGAAIGEPELDETWAAIGNLRPERQTVLVLRYYEDMAHKEIAALLGCSAATVRSRTRRALADLRREVTR